MSDATFHPPRLGDRISPGSAAGYYVDLRPKTEEPSWPPAWLNAPAGHSFVAVAQWGLGAFERYLTGEGAEWLGAARQAGEFLVDEQKREGAVAGGWADPRDYPHTYRVRGPWLSGMAQGQGASLLVRLFGATGEDRFADAARLALRPLTVPSPEGGVEARLGGRPFPEEYPTDPPSFVLNGAVFAFWGVYDVSVGLGDSAAAQMFEEGVETLVANLGRWDTGSWSRYDLYPHPVVNVASPTYHRLHIVQLRALAKLSPRPELVNFAERFEAYGRSPAKRARAFVRKVAFRLLVPKRRRPSA